MNRIPEEKLKMYLKFPFVAGTVEIEKMAKELLELRAAAKQRDNRPRIGAGGTSSVADWLPMGTNLMIRTKQD